MWTVGIIYAGTMGSGSAQACAAAGLDALTFDVAQAAVDPLKARTRKRNSRRRCCPLLQEMAEAGRRGRKTGRGVCTY